MRMRIFVLLLTLTSLFQLLVHVPAGVELSGAKHGVADVDEEGTGAALVVGFLCWFFWWLASWVSW